jgi:hypothetical protein
MGPAMIVEQLDPRGRAIHRVRLPPGPVTIGRAYDNDVIVDDPYVDPHHLRLTPTEDGRIEFADQGSANGTWDQRLHWRVVSGVVRSGLELRIGRTVLRFASPDLQVSPAVIDPAGRLGVEQHLLNPRIAALGMVLAVAGAGIDAYLTSSGEFRGIDFVTPGLAGLLVGAAWAGGWAFANRLVAHRFRFFAHLGWASLIGVAALLATHGARWLEFFLPNAGIEWIRLAAYFGLGAALLAGHFSLVTEWDSKHRWRTALLATSIVTIVVALLASDQVLPSREGAIGSESLKPVAQRLVPAGTIDDFFRRAKSLKTEIDRLAEEGDGG